MTSLVAGRGNLRLVPIVRLAPARRRNPVSLVERLELWADRRRERRALLRCPDGLLKDVGLSRADAVREADKPFWRD
ncbi:hypothetical protein NS228_12660 [Methylobacterium indicum]|uniref:YjiS-like domain-containing protein n=1 Tax=Methylobacterium indicum TaxID=1775910 RepID=A0A8H9C3R4_9HYPH|nr:DUF1127 domain-containing protein [Methylobacterium indicum]KTS38130.1 hypothetical protein NS229_04445 [Methylobacterium indicum]KTS40073.1 hypothetical protein NS228_12660 [Methylobacterium indicum]KTS54251.1 hypothetical protein NS230_01990 [Methylobacterium indicum]BCM81981.1 hypothetical protein mvi_04420 [Methylobacterium indicum]